MRCSASEVECCLAMSKFTETSENTQVGDDLLCDWVRSMTSRGFVKAVNQKMPMPFSVLWELCQQNNIPIAQVNLAPSRRIAKRIVVRYDGNGTDLVAKVFPA